MSNKVSWSQYGKGRIQKLCGTENVLQILHLGCFFFKVYSDYLQDKVTAFTSLTTILATSYK